MKNAGFIPLLIGSTMILLTTAPPTAADEDQIRATALDYIEGWYQGDAARMERALSPHLAKRILASELDVQVTPIVETTALELIQQTRAGGGKSTPTKLRSIEVAILDRFENAASVRVDAGPWIDYMHVAKFGDHWKIVNVLWEIRHKDK